MNVWIVMQGEDHEGGDVLGVFASLDSALAFVEKRQTHEERNDVPGDLPWKVDGHLSWSRWPDWMTIEVFEVTP